VIKRIVYGLLLLIALWPSIKLVERRWAYYTAPNDSGEAKRAYEISQYVLEKDPSWIPDELVFSYAGWYYLNGGSPILINPDYPPLGKYMVGLSQRYFSNEKFLTLFFGLLSFFTFFLFANLFFKNNLLVFFPLILFFREKLFLEQLIYIPLFEIFGLPFLLLSFYFFIKGQQRESFFWVSSFFLGVLWGIKPWMLTTPLVASWLTYLLWQRDFVKLVKWLVSLSVAFLVIIFSYARLLLDGWSFYRVLSIQKWIMWYHQSKITEFGMIWPFIYLKRWYVWWGDKTFLLVDQWNFWWPIMTSLTLILSGLIFSRRWKNNSMVTIVCLWVVFDLVLLSFGTINVRYLFYLLPFIYLLGSYFINIKIFK
jgi:hypothetical protein